MTWSGWEVVMVVVEGAASIALPAWLIRRDEHQLKPHALARAFLPTSFWVAVVVFGPMSLMVHFVRTRRSLAGLGLGLVWIVTTLAVIGLLDLGLGLIPGIFGAS